jgi:hypothetical protein
MPWRNHLPPEAALLIDWAQARIQALAHEDGERGEVGIVGAIILVVGFATMAGLLVAAVTGKLNSWISQIPG